jgi:type VI secretion system protein ImpF
LAGSSPDINGKMAVRGYAPMADITRKTHVSPPLMHAFRAAHEAKDATRRIDMRTNDGDRVIAGRRLRPRQVITEQVLRREVARDLDALLNTVALESTVEMADASYARKSVLNFGLPDISSLTIDTMEIKRIPEEIRAALVNFEPRLAAASLQIERDLTVDSAELKVRFLVRADLTCYPVQVPVEFVADIVESGKIVVNRL